VDQNSLVKAEAGDTVRRKGLYSYETGIVTGVVVADEFVRVYWNSTNALYHETVSIEDLEVMKKHNNEQ